MDKNPDYDFLDHEVTDRASIVFEMFSEKILDHPKVQGNREAKEAAKYIADLLHAFYCSASGKQLEPPVDEE